MIKVCHVTSMHKPFDVRILAKQCKSLSKHYDVSAVYANMEDQIYEGVKIIGVPVSKNQYRRMLTTKPLLKKALEVNADIYQIHDPELLSLIPKLKKYGKKVIFDSHENFPGVLLIKEWMPVFMRKPVALMYERYEKRMLKQADAVFSVTPSIVKRLSETNPHTYLITNYPIYEELPDNRRWGKSVGFAGGVTKEWMHHSVIDSLPICGVKYRIVGGAGFAEYMDQLARSKGWNYVEMLGKIKHEDVNNFLQENSAAMALYTYDDANVNFKEGTLGNQKIFEYMRAGIPIITSHLMLWEEIIRNSDCGICVDPDDIEGIAKAISFFMEHPDEAKRMGDNGHEAARIKYNWSSQEETLFEAYKYVESLIC